MADETSVYQDPNIHITNLRAILQGKTYSMANVTSVSVFTQEASRMPSVVLAIVGGLFVLVALGAGDLRGCFLLLGLPLLMIGILVAVSAKDRHWVRIGSASGETNALSSNDREYIMKIVRAMNDAIVRRG